jgi:aminoglycoside phosphotransferase family enzyme
VQRIARHLAGFHATAATGPGVDEYGSLATVRANWEESFAQMVPFLGRTLSEETNAAIGAYVERFLSKQAAFLERRVSEGRIRDGHGDLHASSICVERERLHLFDCLQFAPRFRCADVSAEVAFLAMDLEQFGRADVAAAFASEYVRDSGDDEMLRRLDFYVCYRAYVRGKVRSLRLAQTSRRFPEGGGLVEERLRPVATPPGRGTLVHQDGVWRMRTWEHVAEPHIITATELAADISPNR